MVGPVASSEEAALLLRLGLAVALGAVVGWERESVGKSAGLRTHMLVALAASLYTTAGALAVSHYHHADPYTRADPVRLVQAVALGIGFLGGGIISGRGPGGGVSGLTTAASIWSTAAIGLAAGLGHTIRALGTTALQFGVLRQSDPG